MSGEWHQPGSLTRAVFAEHLKPGPGLGTYVCPPIDWVITKLGGGTGNPHFQVPKLRFREAKLPRATEPVRGASVTSLGRGRGLPGLHLGQEVWEDAALPGRDCLTSQERPGPPFWEAVSPRPSGGLQGSGRGNPWAPVSVGAGSHYENSCAHWQNSKWGPKPMSKHVVSVPGKGDGRSEAFKDDVSVRAVSSQTQHEGAHLPETSCFESQSLSLPDSPHTIS